MPTKKRMAHPVTTVQAHPDALRIAQEIVREVPGTRVEIDPEDGSALVVNIPPTE